MSQSTSTVWFDLSPPRESPSSWQVERCPTDSLSDLLEKLSQQTNISIEEFSFTYQLEYGKIIEGKDLRYFAESKQRMSKENGSVEWKTVFANNDSVERREVLILKSHLLTNNLISELDDVFYPPRLAPVISVDLRTIFLELDDSKDFEFVPRNADALLDSQNVALFEGIRLDDVKGETPSIVLLETDRKSLFNIKSGESFQSLKDMSIASRISRESHKEQRCYILLRNKSRLPKWPISLDLGLLIAIREGVDFSIDGGIIEVKESSSSVLSRRWIHPLRNRPFGIPSDSKYHILGKQLIQYIGT